MYYTPDREDLFVGYETEKIVHDFSNHFDLFLPEGATQEEYDKVWDEYYTSKSEFCGGPVKSEPYTITGKDIYQSEPFERMPNCVRGRYRTPYLTVEQIEKEGWKITHREVKPKPYKVDWINAKKGDFKLWINLSLHDKMHLGIDDRNGIIFRGKCLSINEFRKICKMVGI